MRVPEQLCLLDVLRYFDDPTSDRLRLLPLGGKKQVAFDPRPRHEIRLDDADPWRPAHGCEVVRGLPSLVLRQALCQRDHRIRVRLSRVGDMPLSVAEISPLTL